MTSFAGFTKETFAVYSPEKWSSNVYNLPRMKTKDAMLALINAAQHGLEEALGGLDRTSSDEIPTILNHKKVDAQWVYWHRDAAARASLASFLEKTPLDQAVIFNISAQEKHAILAVILRQSELWFGVRLAPGAVVDRRNIATKLEHAWERERLLDLLKRLPEGAYVGFEGATILASETTLEHIEQWAKNMTPAHPTFVVGYNFTPEFVAEVGAELPASLNVALASFIPVYRFSAWTRENDLIEATKKIHDEKQQKRRQSTGFKSGDKVKFTTGLFSGKLGVVQDIDTKSHVRVLVGKMSVVVPSADLVAG